MGLVSKALVRALAEEGLCKTEECVADTQSLAEWLRARKIEGAEDILARFFGIEYRALTGEEQLTVISLPEHEEWAVYYAREAMCYVCMRPPSEDEMSAFCARYGKVPLYITDDCSIHAALVREALPRVESAPLGQRVVELRALLKQGAGHVDGMIGMILADALKRDATDIHLYMLQGIFHIDFRIHGQLVPYAQIGAVNADTLFNKLKLMAEMDIAEHRLPQDGHIALSNDGEMVHLRLGTLPLLGGEKIVIRILPEQSRYLSLLDLGFEPMNADALTGLLQAGQGLLLITGPTNSGKTTTLYACLNRLAREGKLVYTVEDPIEAVVCGVQQSQVNVRGGYSFAEGLRGMLRSDPDVLAVGELRDAETVDIAARAALSGHLVVATLHAFDAHQAINRLRDLGLSDLLISAVLIGVLNQRLVARPCEVCEGRGCDENGRLCAHCLGSGTHGRVGVQELWVPSDDERAEIEAGVSGVTLRKNALENGFCSIQGMAVKRGLRLAGNEGVQ